MRNGWIDGVFGDVAPRAIVVSTARIFGQQAPLLAHLMSRLPSPAHHLPHSPHRLAVRGDNRQRTQVVQNILGGDGLLANPALGKGHVLGDILVEVVADHQHVQMFVYRVDRKGPRRVGRRGQHIGLAAKPHDIGRVATARALGVVGVNRPPFESRPRRLDKARLVERVGMDADLHVEFFGDCQTRINGRWRRTPVLVQLEAASPSLNLRRQSYGQRRIALAQKAKVERPSIGRL